MSDDDAVEIEVEGPDGAEGDAADHGGGDDSGAEVGDAEAGDAEAASTADDGAEAGDANGAREAGDSRSDDPLVDRVAEHDEALAAEVAELEEELAAQRETVDDLKSKLARVKADFSNYKERAKRKQQEIRERASEALVERITPVRNDLRRALDQEEGSDIRPGVESTLEKFDEVLEEEGVEPIEPEPGEEVDPNRHQVMLRVESDQPEGTIDEVYEPGYEMGDRVVSEAQVTVSKGD